MPLESLASDVYYVVIELLCHMHLYIVFPFSIFCLYFTFLVNQTKVCIILQASFMPVLVLAARLCPSGMEATLFATLMSISNAGSVTGGLIGAGLTQLLGVTKDSFGNLALLIVICNLSSLLPLPLLGLLPAESPEDKNANIEQTKLN